MNKLKTRVTLLSIFLFLSLPSCQPGGESARPPVRLGEDVKTIIKDTLASMTGPVTLHFFQGGNETAHRGTRAILEFMAESSGQIRLLDHSLEPANNNTGPGLLQGASYGPVVRIEGVNPGSLYFYGYPERKELKPFLDGVLMASGVRVDLPTDAESFLSNLKEDVWIRIFTTPD